MRRRADGGLGRRPGEAERNLVMPESGCARMRPQEWAFVMIMTLGVTSLILAVLLAARITG